MFSSHVTASVVSAWAHVKRRASLAPIWLFALALALSCGAPAGTSPTSEGKDIASNAEALTTGFGPMRASAATSTSITLTWALGGWETYPTQSYTVLQGSTPLTLTWTPGTDPVLGKTVSATVTGLAPCTTYQFSVAGSASVNNEAFSQTIGPLTAGTLGTAPHVAPPALPAQPTDFITANQWLWSASNPGQANITTPINPAQVSVVRGRVRALDGSPLACVTVQAVQPVGSGSVVTDVNGAYAIAVNSGASAVLNFTYGDGEPGTSTTLFLPVQRTVPTRALAYAFADDVRLTPNDAAPQLAIPKTIITGPVQTDDKGAHPRQAFLGFDPNVKFFDVTTNTAIPSPPSIRIKEYTTGAAGPAAMPGNLPASSAYTYALNISIVGHEGHSISVTPPADLFVEATSTASTYSYRNILPGTVIPMGSYNETSGLWTPSSGNSGCVIAFDGTAGSITPPSSIPGVSCPPIAVPLSVMAGQFGPKALLWHAQLAHFSSYDANFGFGAALGSGFPTGLGVGTNATSQPCATGGSIIQCENQTLGEVFPIAGTGMSLYYNSDRHPGRMRIISATVDAQPYSSTGSGSAPSATIAKAYVAGRELDNPVQTTSTITVGTTTHNRVRYDFTWDGKDSNGRTLFGRQPAVVKVGYTYPGSYTGVSTFGALPGYSSAGSVTGDYSNVTLTFWREIDTFVTSWDDGINQLGGLSLSDLHYYDATSRTIFYGDGRTEYAESPLGPVRTVAGGLITSGSPSESDGGPAVGAALGAVSEVTTNGTATVFRDDQGIWLVSPVDSTHAQGALHRLSPAANTFAQGLALGPDGSIYYAAPTIVASGAVTLHRIAPTSAGYSDSVIAGCDAASCISDWTTSSNPFAATIPYINDITVADDGTVYFLAENAGGGEQIARLLPTAPTSTLEWFAGLAVPNPTSSTSGIEATPGLPGRSLSIDPSGALRIAWSPSGVLWIAREGRIVGVRIADAISLGNIPAFEANTEHPIGITAYGIAAGRDGSLFVTGRDGGSALGLNCVIQRLDGSGTSAQPTDIYASAFIAGTTECGFGDGPNGVAQLVGPQSVSVSSDGSIVFLDSDLSEPPSARAIRQIDRLNKGGVVQDGSGNYYVVSRDGTQKFEFSAAGLHLKTIDTLTGTTVRTFSRLPGQLTIADADGVLATVVYGAVFNQITSRYGQSTYVDAFTSTTGTNILLTSPSPLVEYQTLFLDSGGLLQKFQDKSFLDGAPAHTFVFDPTGLLTRDTEPSGAFKTLSRSNLDDPSLGTGWEVDVTTTLGRTTKHLTQTAADGTTTRRLIDPAGITTTTRTSPDGSTVTTTGPLLSATQTYSPDPRYGNIAPYVSSTTRTAVGGSSAPIATINTTRSGVDNNGVSTNLNESKSYSVSGGTPTWNTQTSMTYGAGGTVTSTSPAGRVFTASIDGHDHLTSLTPPTTTRAETYSFAHDSYGRVTAVMHGASPSSCPATPPTLSCATGSNGAAPPTGCRWTLLGYDANPGATAALNGLVQCRSNSIGQVTRMTSDAIGRLTSISPPSHLTGVPETISIGNKAWSDYSVSVPSGETAAAPVNQSTFTTTFTTSSTNAFPVTYQPPPITTASGTFEQTPWTSAFDLDEAFQSLTRPNGARTVHRDTAGRVGSFDDLAGWSGTLVPISMFGSTTESYDPNFGYLSQLYHTDGSSNFVDFEQFSPNASSLSDYSVAIWQIGSTYYSSSVTHQLDSILRVQSQAVVANSTTSTVAYQYDADNLVTGTTFNGGTAAFVREPASGRVTQVSVGSLTEFRRHNEFGELGLLLGSTFPSSGTLPSAQAVLGVDQKFTETVQRDANGRITNRYETTWYPDGSNDVAHDAYFYTLEGWLALDLSFAGGTSGSFQYDANGNVRLPLGSTPNTACDPNAQDQIGCQTYDLNGFQTGRNNDLLTYDAFGHLTSYSKRFWNGAFYIPKGQVTYGNNSVGQRIFQTNGTSWTSFIYDDALLPVATIDSSTAAGPSGDVYTRYVYGPTSITPFAMVRGGTTYRIVADHLGSVRAVVNASTGAIMEGRRYDAWGNLVKHLEASGWMPIPFGFAGGIEDRFTGLVRFGARDYDPTTGRWTSRDPALFAGGQGSLYMYAGGDPINKIDPSGLWFGVTWADVDYAFTTNPGLVTAAVETPLIIIEAGAASILGDALLTGGIQALGRTFPRLAVTLALAGGAVRNCALPNGVDAGGPTITLYHGGSLIDGAVQGGRTLSTTTELSHAEAYAQRLGGDVTKFEVPKALLDNMEASGQVSRGIDTLAGSGSVGDEYRFAPSAAPILNDYIK